jgi:hypothetical protein
VILAGFDGCVKEIFAALCYGATLVLNDPDHPLAHLSSVDATMITPTLLTTMEPEEYPNLKIVSVDLRQGFSILTQNGSR